MTITNKSLPGIFHFTYHNSRLAGAVYTATYQTRTDEWTCSGADAIGNSFSLEEINGFIGCGLWTILECENIDDTKGDDTCGETSNTLFDNGQPPIVSEFILQEAECADKLLYNRHGKSVTQPNVNSPEYLKAQRELQDRICAEEPLEMIFDECCEDISLLDYLKEFSEMTGASVTIMDGTYLVHQDNAEYVALCDCELTEICDAITTLYMAAN